MPRFAVVAVLLLAALSAAGAAAAWHFGWLPGLAKMEAASGAADKRPASGDGSVERAAAAVRDHDLAVVRRYLAAGGDPNAVDASGETLLNMAVLHGSPDILEALLTSGADPDRAGRNGLSPLTIAALAGRQGMLQRLMQANAAEPAVRVADHAAVGAPAADGARRGGVGDVSPASGSSRGHAPLPGGSDTTSAVLASLAGDGEPQGLLPAEPYASMSGLVINPIARPQPGSPMAASPGSAAPVAQAAAQAGTPSPAPGAANAGGAPAAWVTAAQKRLTQLGYYKGPITGFAGSITADAVKRYQAVAGLPQDGIVSADLLRRIGAVVEAPAATSAATAAAPSPAPAATAAPAAGADAEQAQSAGPGLQQVRNALGQEFNSATRPDALRQHCQANTNAWVYDEAVGRSLFCRDVLGAPPR